MIHIIRCVQKFDSTKLPSKQIPQLTDVQIPIVGIVGGIGSGKSTVVGHVDGLRIRLIQADEIAHELLRTSSIRAAVIRRFGESILDEAGEINRRVLGGLVFGETREHRENREDLEGILHPAIRSRVEEIIKSTGSETDVIILDAALLLEAGWKSRCDAVIFIDTSYELRQERVMRNRGWTADELPRREALQWPIDRKRRESDFVVNNEGTLKESGASMERILRQICESKRATLTNRPS